jgi:hypothetical protein
VDFPTININAGLPGASADIMASSVATPLERQLGHIAGITEMTSSSSLGSTNITIQFDLSRNIDGAARDVEAAINAARTYLPAEPAVESYLSQGESGGRAHHDSGAHFRRLQQRAMYDSWHPRFLPSASRRSRAWARFPSAERRPPLSAWN